MKEQKKGISIIVLVITIVVMIILAASIILTLDGNKIIGKANEARNSNDYATAREVVAVAKSEWSFQKQKGYNTFREYAESKLKAAGYDMENIYIQENGIVLFDTAARFAKAGVRIGTEVQGYVLNEAKSSYTTSGKENTISSESGTAATLVRDTNISWTYIGADEEGNALIVGSVTSTTPKVTLGGKGGYLNGSAELDKICETMYSSNMGAARSMNITDVIRVLEYIGARSAYWNKSSSYIPTIDAKTIGQIAYDIGYNTDNLNSNVPEAGNKIVEYKSDYFYIDKTTDEELYNTARANIIYPASSNDKLSATYWLSSKCISVNFGSNLASFNTRIVDGNKVDAYCTFNSNNASTSAEYAIRPVVKLESGLDVIYTGAVATLKNKE